MARLSLCLLGVPTLCTSCFDAPPEYSAPGRVPPVVNALQTVPSLTEVHFVDAQAEFIDFDVPFRSEDGGNALIAVFIRDMDPSESDLGKIITLFSVATSDKPFQEQTGRNVRWTWGLNQGDSLGTQAQGRPAGGGCHSVTLLLTYEDNTFDRYTVADDSLAALETWWFNFEGGGGLVADCPPNTN